MLVEARDAVASLRDAMNDDFVEPSWLHKVYARELRDALQRVGIARRRRCRKS